MFSWLSGLVPRPDPEPESDAKETWEWIPLPADAPQRFSELVLLRAADGSLARDTKDSSAGFAIIRRSLGKGRGRGWQFQRASIGTRWGIESLPVWLSRC